MRYFFTACLFSISCLVYGQDATLEKAGNWNVAGNWDNNVIGDQISQSVLLKKSKSYYVVNGDYYIIGDIALEKDVNLYVQPGGVLIIGSASSPANFTTDQDVTLYINGDLEIFGDLITPKKIEINITGSMRVHGNADLKNNSDFTVSGNLVIDGNMIAKNGTNFDVSGSVDVGGDLEIGNSSTLTGTGTFTVGGECTGNTSFCNNVTLPVELLSFSAKAIGEVVVVKWTTVTEENNDYFSVQLSRDGQEYSTLRRVTGAGNSDSQVDYEFTDNNPVPGITYYRITQTDYDGLTTQFAPVMVNRSFSGEISLYPNPSLKGQKIQLYTGGAESDRIQLKLYSLSGNVVWENGFEGNASSIEFPTSLNNGVYLLEVNNGVERKLHRLVLR